MIELIKIIGRLLTVLVADRVIKPSQADWILESAEETTKAENEDKNSVFDKMKDYINHIKNTGLGKKKSLEFIEKFVDGLKAESEGKE